MKIKSTIGLLSIAIVMVIPNSWAESTTEREIIPPNTDPSCETISIIGQWQFVDQKDSVFTMDFLDEKKLTFNGMKTSDSWFISKAGILYLDLSPPQAPTRAAISKSNKCIASELTIMSVTPLLADGIIVPAVGKRIESSRDY